MTNRKITTLQELRAAHEEAYAELLALIERKFPGLTIWHWYRALSAVNGESAQRNADTSRDVELAGDAEIKAAHDEYIRLLHIFYRTRDGEHGVLGWAKAS